MKNKLKSRSPNKKGTGRSFNNPQIIVENQKLEYSVGDVVWSFIPYREDKTQGKIRPVIILQVNDFDVKVAIITTREVPTYQSKYYVKINIIGRLENSSVSKTQHQNVAKLNCRTILQRSNSQLMEIVNQVENAA